MTSDENVVDINPKLTELSKKLSPFLEAHPGSRLVERKDDVVLADPWDDDTIILRFSDDPDELIEDLNHIYLPPRLTAIWHKDTKDLEVIFTAYPLPDSLKRRKFTFQDEPIRDVECQFEESSQRLMRLAHASRPVSAPTDTSHRNLQSFSTFQHHVREHPDSDLARDGAPISFWIRNIDFDEDAIVALCRKINFYMSYADPKSPLIVVHRTQVADKEHIKDPYPKVSDFPQIIRGKSLDSYLLGLWESSVGAADPFRRFIYLYQILEYCAFYHVQEGILKVIRRAIQTPDALSRVPELAREVLDAVVDDRLQEAQKLVLCIESCVRPEKLWTAIEPNAESFSKQVHFDGGFSLPALINSDLGYEDFARTWNPKFADSIRKIRNALVHARESRQVGVIAPTQDNYDKLAPWLYPLRITAMDAIVFNQ